MVTGLGAPAKAAAAGEAAVSTEALEAAGAISPPSPDFLAARPPAAAAEEATRGVIAAAFTRIVGGLIIKAYRGLAARVADSRILMR